MNEFGEIADAAINAEFENLSRVSQADRDRHAQVAPIQIFTVIAWGNSQVELSAN